MSQEINRRKFLLGLAAFALPVRSGAYPLSQILGPGNPSYIQGFVSRLDNWHSGKFGSIQKGLSASEKRFCASALLSLTRWDEPLGDNQAFDRVLFSHKSGPGKTSHLRYAIAPQTWTSALKEEARKVARERGGISLPQDVYGFGWDLGADEWKLYRRHRSTSDITDTDLKSLLEKDDDALLRKPKISCTTYKGGRVVDRKLIVAYREVPKAAVQATHFGSSAVAMMQVRRVSGLREWHYRLNSFNLSFLVEPLRTVAQSYGTEFALMPHSLLWRSAEQQTLYFP